jgi:putative ABC transport system permease protein
LGATRADIRHQFLTEATILSGLGGLTGTLLGIIVVAGYATLRAWPVVFPTGVLLGGVVGALVVGAVAGVYPSVTASRLPPTEALSG